MLEAETQEQGHSGQRLDARLRDGQAVTGTVVQIGVDSVFIDIGATAEGRIDRREFEDKRGQLSVQVGQTVRATVVQAHDGSAPVLSTALGRGHRGSLDPRAFEQARAAGLPIEGTVAAIVKGGAQIQTLGQRAFCPASQFDTRFVADLSSFEGQTLQFLVTEVKNSGRDIVLSRKALLLQEQSRAAEQVVAGLEVGADYPAQVVSVQKFGAFVDIGGGVEGLIHISELAKGRVERVEDVATVGETLTVRLLEIQPSDKPGARPKLRLSLRALDPDAGTQPEEGEILDATVSKVVGGGLLVETAKGEGFVPGRELGAPRQADVRKLFPVGHVVRVVTLGKGRGRGLSLSIARVGQVEERQNFRQFTQQGATQGEGSLGTLGSLLREKLHLPEPAPEPPAPPPGAGSAPARAAADLSPKPAEPPPTAPPASGGKRGSLSGSGREGVVRRRR